MIKIYLRLDIYELSKKDKKSKLIDQVDLEPNEIVDDFLSHCHRSNYAELYLVTWTGKTLLQNIVCCFKQIRLKNKDKRKWITCQKQEV